MPNNITHKLVIPKSMSEEVLSVIAPDGQVSFATLIPEPPHLYHGNLNAEDERDFPINWNSWNCENWGTKWDAYHTEISHHDDKVEIRFQTAWSVPHPFMAALSNRWPDMEFDHRYFDEMGNYWGRELWRKCPFSDGRVVRTEKHYSRPEDRQALQLELLGYEDEPTTEE